MAEVRGGIEFAGGVASRPESHRLWENSPPYGWSNHRFDDSAIEWFEVAILDSQIYQIEATSTQKALTLSIRKEYERKDSQGKEEASGEERGWSLFVSLSLCLSIRTLFLSTKS
jgi:hypothetical protein